jgi:hypothetical protein
MLSALSRKHLWLAAFFTILCVGSREWAAALLLVWVIIAGISAKGRRRNAWFACLFAFVGVAIVYGVHLKFAPTVFVSDSGGSSAFNIASWTKQGGWIALKNVLRYRLFGNVAYWPLSISFPVTSLIGILSLRDRRLQLPLALVSLGYTMYFLLVSPDAIWSDFWGMFIIPTFLMFSTLIMTVTFQRNSPVDTIRLSKIFRQFRERQA